MAAVQIIKNTTFHQHQQMNHHINNTSNSKNNINPKQIVIQNTINKIHNINFNTSQLRATQMRPSCRFEIIKILHPINNNSYVQDSEQTKLINDSDNEHKVEIDVILDIAHNYDAMKVIHIYIYIQIIVSYYYNDN